MTRDPFYQKIIAGLRGTLDPDAFERCAAALLRSVYPGLVPVRGGSDGGMDGAIADGKGLAYPLVCTTSTAVLANLRRSLRSYLKEGGTRRRVVAATSQELTARRRRNLEIAARQLGFTLVNVHTQAAMADLLYDSPEWCRELLNLIGNPPPLSALPINHRPSLTPGVIGRQDDLAWLRDAPGDLLLVGQPGAGKTHLLSALAREGKGLFVVDDDLGRIADGLRSQRPEALLVDDAHRRLGLLSRLIQLRAETGCAFRVVADCWPGEQDAVARALGVTDGAIRCLGPLRRAQIVEIIHACGIGGPNALMHQLVHQAGGRPGLAVTLCNLCLREGTRKIALADALCRDVRTTFEELVGPAAISVLAAVAVGGESGMSMAVVARELGLAGADVWNVATRLAAGGVLFQTGGRFMAVRPEALRHALVRDVFFRGPAPLPFDGLVAGASDLQSVVRTLIGARGRGGDVPLHLLTGLMTHSYYAEETWELFASLGEAESRWVLREHPGRLHAVAPVALHHVPEETIPALLTAEAAEASSSGSAGGRALEAIRRWVNGAFPGTGDPVRRRQTLLQSALDWLDGGGRQTVASRAVCLALSPDFQDWETDPGDRNRLCHRHGFVTPAEMTAIQAFWPGVRQRLECMQVEDWTPWQDLYREWSLPGRGGVSLRRGTIKSMVRFSTRLLCDLARLGRGSQALLHWAHWIAGIKGVRLGAKLDPEFAVLYTHREPVVNWQAAALEHQPKVMELAARWATGDPRQLARRLARWEADLNAAGGRVGARWSWTACVEIARLAPAPGDWAMALTEAGVGGDLIEPFLRRSADAAEPGWVERLRACLDSPTSRGAAAAVVLTSHQPPPDLLVLAVERSAGLASMIWSLCANAAVPEAHAELLLRHHDRDVAVQAALGEWHAPQAGGVRSGLQAAWRGAVLCAGDDMPAAAFRGDATLARDWLAARFKSAPRFFWQESATVQAAYAALTAAQRLELLGVVPDELWADEAVRRLVGDDADLYGRLLADDRLARHHLDPLRGRPEGAWFAKASLALDAGYTPEEVVDAVTVGGECWDGTMSQRWAEWVKHFEALEAHADRRIRRVGKVGREAALERLERAKRDEREDDLDDDH
jgi:hypothetical protein